MIVRSRNGSGSDRRWSVGPEDVQFFGRAGTEICFCRLYTCVAMPKRDLSDVLRGLPDGHCDRMADHMRCHPLAMEGWDDPRFQGDMEIEAVSESIRAHGLPSGVDEHAWMVDVRTNIQPVTEYGSGFFSKRQFTLAAPFAHDADAFELGGGTDCQA